MMTNQIEVRMALERKVVKKLLDVARAAGWSIPSVYDGGDEPVPTANDEEVLDAVFNVDESAIKLHKVVDGKKNTGCVWIVLGNAGYDCISDNTTGELFVKEVIEPMDAFTDNLGEESH